MAFIKELLDKQWAAVLLRRHALRIIRLCDRASLLVLLVIFVWFELRRPQMNWWMQCSSNGNRSAGTFAQKAIAGKPKILLFTHQLDNWWVPASVQCWSLGERKTIVNNKSIFCIILEPRNRMNLSSQSLPLWFGALELNNQLSAKNNGSGRWGPRKRLLRQSPVLATPGLPTWGDMWC